MFGALPVPRVGRQVAVVEPVVGVQRGVAVVFVEAAVKIVAAGAGHELDLYGAFAVAVGAAAPVETVTSSTASRRGRT